MAPPKRTLETAIRRSKPNSGAHPDLACSYDLRGRLLEINESFERLLGYSRPEILGANLREFLDPVSWELIRQSILQQTGGAAPEPQNIQIRRKSGELRMLEIATRLVFDRGCPVAVEAAGRDLTPPDVHALQETRALLSTTTTELNRSTGHLKELHRLSTAQYSDLAEVFADFLKTGCDILSLNYGAVLVREGGIAVVAAAEGNSSFIRPGTRIPWASFDEPGELGKVHADFEVCIHTPVLAGTEHYGTLIFSANKGRENHLFTSRDQEIIELMSRSLGRFILEDRMQAERKSAAALVRTRSGILERVAGNRPLTETLAELGRLLENQCDGCKCVFMLAEDGPLSTATAPSLPAAFLNKLRQQHFRLAPGPAPARDAPLFNAAHFEFAKSSGLLFSAAYPIVSGAGNLLGALVLLQPAEGQNPAGTVEAVDAEVVMMTVRMAGIAIEQRYLADRLAYQAQHDPLTGLPNRFRLLEILDLHVAEARARNGIVAVLFIDLDRFKQINDTLGHSAGDQLLIGVAERLRSCLTSGDFAARLGGDEFAVVLSDPRTEEDAIEASSHFLDVLRTPYLLEGRELFVTASIGISFFPGHGGDSSALLRSADSAMYRAKNEGKNGIERFVPNGHHGGIERLELENGLRRALEKSEFELNFQPIVSIDGELDGFEVLLGWNHSTLGRVSPVRFIPIAEETGLIIPIGQWVLEQACCHGARWIKAGLPLKTISVNVSALQFAKPNFVETVALALEATGFPARLLELELTEGMVLRDIDDSIQRMTQLQDIGVSMTIDDFGTGYSSLNYLRRLPVAGLKIDQSFLRDLQGPSSTLTVVETIVSLAHTMNLSVVAEGVETLRELELMRAAGCDRVQGHLYGRSLNAAAAGELLARPGRLVPIPV